jgi:hypothetical protein
VAVLVTTLFFAGGLIGLQRIDYEAGRAAARSWREGG